MNLFTQLKEILILRIAIVLFLLCVGFKNNAQTVSFNNSPLQNAIISNSTSLQFGPDNRLYVSERYGIVKALIIQRNGPNDYVVTSEETITLIENIPNRDDQGNLISILTRREVTGIVVGGTSNAPILYVSSSDYRVGGGGGGGEKNLDTNSGIITRLTWIHTQPPSQTDFSTLSDDDLWEKVDLVRGLPRSEENHATNGMELTNVNGTNYLIVCSGGNTNGGAPSNNFAKITEYALGSAILSVDLDALNAMPVLGSGNNKYIYDIPTVDDPTRANANGIDDPNAPGYNGIDINDPFGGNDGLNQAKVVPGGPVQIFSPGYRNTYDIALTESGRIYVTDNGANGGWGGLPENEGPPVGGVSSVTNNYNSAEPGSTIGNPYNGQFVNNKDHLELVTGLGANTIHNYVWGSYYGGHPTPIRANPASAGLYTHDHADGGSNGTAGGVFRSLNYDPNGTGDAADPTKALPADWPPVPLAIANAIEGDFQNPGVDDNALTIWPNNSNGIDEYTATNFNGAMQGNLIAGRSGGFLHRVILNADGSLNQLISNWSSPGGNPLGITCQSDTEIFPGTIWVATFDTQITILEPSDYDGGGSSQCYQPGEPEYEGTADYDQDGYTNDDEVDNGTDHCSGGIFPNDFDDDKISDLNDPDDDNDGIADVNDPFQMGTPFDLPLVNELFSDQLDLGGYLGLGLTGLMNNNDPNDNYLNWLDDPDASDTDTDDILGGAIGAVTMYMTSGDALGNSNNQEKGFQFGVNVDQSTGTFTVKSRMMAPFHNHTGNESQGIFIGTGDQDNYIKLVMNASGLEILDENAGVPNPSPIQQNIASPANSLDLYFIVDPTNGQVQAKYAIDEGPVVLVGSLVAQGAVLNAIQQAGQPLAVGLIGTSGGNPEFGANWDFFRVTASEPFITQTLPDLDRAINSPDEAIDLDEYFDDDAGVNNLTYSVEGNTNNAVGATINNNLLTLSFPSTPASSDITIRATDGDGMFTEQTFTVNVIGQTVLYRVNSGGALISAIDGGVDWEKDTQNFPSQFLSDPGSNGMASHNITTFDPSVDLSTTPEIIFQRERFDASGGTEMAYTFPVSQDGDYEIRFYMGNGFSGTSNPGERIFDIEIEGVTVFTGIDLVAEFGHLVGGMKSHTASIDDGAINIRFIHNTNNPIVNGIEVLSTDGQPGNPPITVQSISNQNNEEGEQVDLAVVASGGDPNENFTYSATGLPPDLDIEPTNGHIFGTIATGAASGGPNSDGVYNVTITVDKPSSNAVDETFTWTITDGAIPNQWTLISNVTEHIPRHENSFVQAGDKFYLFGGREQPKVLEIYDYNTNTWTTGATAPIVLNHFQAVAYQGLIWAIAAFKDNNFPDEDPAENIYMYDPAADEWISGPAIPENRRRGSAGVVVYNDKFYIVSGNTNGHSKFEDDGVTIAHKPWFDEYDPATNTWTELPDAPRARDHFHAVVVGDKLYLASGRKSSYPGNIFNLTVPEVDVYDFTTGLWSTLPSGSNIPTPRAGASVVNFQNEVVVIGGEGGGNAYANTDALDVNTGTWRSLADLNFGRHGTGAIVTGDGIHITSGSPNQGGGNQNNMEVYGIDNPTGIAIGQSALNAPQNVNFGSSSSTTVDISNTNGNQGIYMHSFIITGTDASDFSVTNGDLTDFLLPAGGIHQLELAFNPGSSGQKTAILEINYGGNSTLQVNLQAGGSSNNPPTADAGGDQNVTDTDGNGSENITLDGSGSSDSDGNITDYEWSENGNPIATGVNPTVNLAVGIHTITLTVTDDDLATDTDQVVITINAQPQGDQVVSFTLIDAGTDQPIAAFDPIPNGAQLDLATLPAGLNIRANTSPTTVGSVKFSLTGAATKNQIESKGPYALFGDVNGNYNAWNPPLGNYSLSATPYAQSGGNGNAGTPLTINFSVVDQPVGGNTPPTADAGGDQNVTDTDGNGSENITLDGSGSSDSDGNITDYEWSENGNPIATGANPTVNLAVGIHTITLTVTDDDLATDTDQVVITINSVAGNTPPVADAGGDQNVTDTDGNGSENITLDGSGSSDSDGNITDYEWSENGNPIATGANPTVNLAVGIHTITLTVTDDDLATDTDQVEITINAQPQGDQVVSFTLIDAGTDQPIAAFDPIPNGAQLDLTTLPNNLNIRANTNPSTVGSVVFNLSGAVAYNRTESAAPYALFGDSGGNYHNWSPVLGSYTLTGTPFTKKGGNGNAGTLLSINFSVVNSAASKINNSEKEDVITGNTPLVDSEEIGIKLVYPNPIEDMLFIRCAGIKGKVNIYLVDPLGRTRYHETQMVSEGQEEISVDLSKTTINPGVIFLGIEAENFTSKMTRLVKY